MSPAHAKTILLGWVIFGAFVLGRYSVDFSGRASAWLTAAGCALVLIAGSLYLLRDFWKPGTR